MCATKYQQTEIKATDILLTKWKLRQEKNSGADKGYPLVRRQD
jgi:hypothetical protein